MGILSGYPQKQTLREKCECRSYLGAYEAKVEGKRDEEGKEANTSVSASRTPLWAAETSDPGMYRTCLRADLSIGRGSYLFIKYLFIKCLILDKCLSRTVLYY